MAIQHLYNGLEGSLGSKVVVKRRKASILVASISNQAATSRCCKVDGLELTAKDRSAYARRKSPLIFSAKKGG
jgi:hypothetical protein